MEGRNVAGELVKMPADGSALPALIEVGTGVVRRWMRVRVKVDSQTW
jgi:hypothetical protein